MVERNYLSYTYGNPKGVGRDALVPYEKVTKSFSLNRVIVKTTLFSSAIFDHSPQLISE
jgi:hypothetical protein